MEILSESQKGRKSRQDQIGPYRPNRLNKAVPRLSKAVSMLIMSYPDY